MTEKRFFKKEIPMGPPGMPHVMAFHMDKHRPPHGPPMENVEIDVDMDMHHEQHVFQKLIDDTLHVYFLLPGADKANINLRAKPDTMLLDSSIKEELKEIMGEQEISLKIRLIESINPDTIAAKYADGILKVQAQIRDPAKDVQIA